MENYLTIGILIFFGINLVNVMLSTMKSILTIRSTRLVATIFNALSYGFYALIVKQMSGFDTYVVVAVTIIANLIGVYFSMWLLDKLKKDKVWKIQIVASENDFTQLKMQFINHGISFNNYDIYTKYGLSVGVDVFSNNQTESALVKEILAPYKVKYNVSELSKSL